MALRAKRLRPPFNDQPHDENGRHTQAWNSYHQNVAFELEALPATIMTGTTAGDDADVGMIGEYFVSEVTTGIAAASGVPMNVTSFPLTAGDWVVGGNVVTAPGGATQTNFLQAGVGTVSGSIPAPNAGAFAMLGAAAAGRALGLPAGMRRINIAAPATLFLVANVNFFAGTLDVYGALWARRVR